MARPRLGRHLTECQHSHMLLSDSRLARTRERGFTLIELLITVAIVAIVASLAYPSFMGAVRKSRRSEAFDMTTRIQQAQEKWRANHSAYTADLVALGDNLSTVSTQVTTPHGYYQLSVTVPADATAGSMYTITATAAGSQTADTQCATMTATMQAGRLNYSPAVCWAK